MAETFPPSDSRAEVPDVEQELRALYRGLLRQERPTTVLHALIAEGQPLTVNHISALTGLDSNRVDWTLDVLCEDELVLRLPENGHVKYTPFAPAS